MPDASLTLRKAALQKRRAQLSLEKQALLEERLCGDQKNICRTASPQVSLSPVKREGDLPLSFAQQRLWFLDQLEPDSPFYNTPVAVHLRGRLNLAALEHGLNAIVCRHEVLRTTFESMEGRPVQRIAPILRMTLPVTNLQDLSGSEREVQMRQLITEDAQCPFDLVHGPLLRARVVRLAEDEHIFLLNIHHIISDGWSMGIFMRELTAFYQSCVLEQLADLPVLPLQYADYAIWQRQWLQGETLEQQLTYWKRQLADSPVALDLPTDYPRPAIQTFRGRQQSFAVTRSVSQALQGLARHEQVTLFILLFTAFKVLLYRYTGQPHIVVGTPIANRSHCEIEGLIGFFVNTLALHTDLSGGLCFREALARVREVALNAYAHQDVPFEMVVEALHPPRDLSRTPLFQVMFVLQNAPLEAQALLGLTTQLWEVESATAKFDLTLSLTEAGEGLTGLIEYNTDLFEAGTIARWVSHYQTLLESIVADPGQRIEDLGILPAVERQQLLLSWNATQTPYPHKQCVHQLFEAQAADTPEAIALVCEDQHLTYTELNCRANQLAYYLQRLGVGPEVSVGIAVERSVEMMIGLLGILKAGGAYIPLDPTYPPERLAFMLANAQVSLLLTQSKLTNTLPDTPAKVIELDLLTKELALFSSDNPKVLLYPESLAYVIYTSGSTGKPKGAMNTHGGLLNRLWWMQDTYRLAADDVVLQKTPFSFDVSVWEFFWPLLVGARLVMARPEGHKDPEYLVSTLVQSTVTTLHFVPSMLQAFLEGAQVERCRSLRRVICSGEALPGELQKRFFERLSTELHNLYGPTEAAVDVTYWPCQPTHEARSVPIGWPVANTQMYILDGQGQPVPIGIPGELYIGGVQVGRGYLHRPELTAERFVPDRFSRVVGSRLYRTGDLARYRADGAIEFLGRVDHQVKIRGFRIELGEIESVLAQHPGVQEAVVVAREVEAGDKRLVGYVGVGAESTLTSEALRLYLHGKLPEYMVPTAWVLLAALPLTPNGKVDRRALPAPERSQIGTAGTFVAPRDALEWQLVRIWEDLLHVQSIGVKGNFFDLGGHSLLAIQLMARIQRELKCRLPVSTLFQGATVEHLAMALRQHGELAVSSSLVKLQSGNARRPPLFLIHPGGGHILCYTELVRLLGDEQPCYALQARGLEDEQAPDTQVEVMAQHYVSLLKTVQPEGPYLLAGWSLGGVIAFEMAQQLMAQGKQVALVTLIDAFAPEGSAADEVSSIDAVDELEVFAYLALNLGLPLEMVAAERQRFELLTLDERLIALLEHLKQANLAPPDMEPLQLRRLFDILKSHIVAQGRYSPRSYAGSLVLFQADDLVAGQIPAENSGWRALARGGVAVHTLSGNHYGLLRKPTVETLAGQLRIYLQTLNLEREDRVQVCCGATSSRERN